MSHANLNRYSAKGPQLVTHRGHGTFLRLADGRRHWLSWWERFQIRRGWTTLRELERKHWRTAL